jgi:hypothetical protein
MSLYTYSNISPPERVLIFGHLSDRDSTALLKAIAKSLQEGGIQVQHIIFTTFEEGQGGTTAIGINHKPFT